MSYVLNPDQQAVCTRAMGRFGRREQAFKVAEELRELAAEVEELANGGGDVKRLVDERADVAIVLWQFDELLLPGLRYRVAERIGVKINRLEARIHE